MLKFRSGDDYQWPTGWIYDVRMQYKYTIQIDLRRFSLEDGVGGRRDDKV